MEGTLLDGTEEKKVMELFELIAPCHFGMEAVLKREIIDLGYEVTRVEDGRVTFEADAEGICRANVFLRTTERILVCVGRFKAYTFDELFEKTKELDWDRYIPENGKFWVTKATSVKSKLFSTTDIQRIVKKSVVDCLKDRYSTDILEESGNDYPIRASFNKDEVVLTIDTSGESLHKRGYRKLTSKAPITETLAAAILLLSPWNGERILLDPFCGSGTFPIEAAMIAANMAPGMNRGFLAEKWTNIIPKKYWYESINEANDLINMDIKTDIQGSDIDGSIVKAARENASLAGVDSLIHFQQKPVDAVSHAKKYGFIITNPPYGERLEEKENLPELYGQIGDLYKKLDSWSAYIITAYDKAEEAMGVKADKNRKIYNGMLKTYLYQFMGPKPPKRKI